MGRRTKEAIDSYTLQGMRFNIGLMAARMAAIRPLHLTHQEVLDLVAPPEHHTILREAADVAAISNEHDAFSVSVPTTKFGIIGVSFLMRTIDDIVAPLRPRHPQYFTTPVSEGTRTKLHAWIDWRMEVGREFGIVNYALSVLAAKCTTPQEVRFLFPSVLALCAPAGVGYDNELQEYHDKVRDFITPRHTPLLNSTERKIIREAAGYVSAASVLPREVPDDTQNTVTVSIDNMPNFNYDGLELSRAE